LECWKICIFSACFILQRVEMLVHRSGPFRVRPVRPPRLKAHAPCMEADRVVSDRRSFDALPAMNDEGYRSVRRIESVNKIPFWPTWAGGGIRAMLLNNRDEWDPFLLLAHHKHSFSPWDPLRRIQKSIMPEGFPMHAHGGIETVTYMIEGGFLHCDSHDATPSAYRKGSVQWMEAGTGILHQEMFETFSNRNADIELYQLWINTPTDMKMRSSSVTMLGDEYGRPLPVVRRESGDGRVCRTEVIAGIVDGQSPDFRTNLPVTILRCTMQPGADFEHTLPSAEDTAVLYVRRGTILLGRADADKRPTRRFTYGWTDLFNQEPKERMSEDATASEGDLVVLERDGTKVRFTNTGPGEADVLFLSGPPLREPIIQPSPDIVCGSMDQAREMTRRIRELYREYFGSQVAAK